MNKSKLWRKALKHEKISLEFLKELCKLHELDFKKGTRTEDRKFGIDAWVENCSIDVKHTLKIFLGKYSLINNKFFARHPFRSTTKAQLYCVFFDLKEDSDNNLVYFGTIEERLLEYFKDVESLEKAKQLLRFFDNRTYDELGFSSIEHMMLSIQYDIKPLLKDQVIYDFEVEKINDSFNLERSIHIIKQDDFYKMEALKQKL